MSTFWSWFIIILTVGNILACWWLIRWTAKPRTGEAASTETTGHVWDDDLTEYNQPMPRWWLMLFYITIVFALIYLVLYPGLGSYPGVLGWSQYKEYREEVQAAQEQVAPLFEKYVSIAIPELARNEEAMRTGQRLFANNCAVCHGSDAGGARGFPNLRDDAWLYGGSPETIRTSILQGRNGAMPPFGPQLGERGVREVAAYVYSLSGREWPRADLVRAGEQRFNTMCAACHGADGKGNQEIGAPDLTDDAWLHGGSMHYIRETITNGRQGNMPAHEELLGTDRAHVLAAYVYSLGQEELQRESGH